MSCSVRGCVTRPDQVMTSEPWRSGAGALRRGLASGSWSCEDIVRSVQGRVSACASLEAWAATDFEGAVRVARDHDEAGGAEPLRGIPFGVKDVIAAVGLPMSFGCAGLDPVQP